MINIKIVDDNEYNSLLKLYQDYQKVLPTKHSNFTSAVLLNKEITTDNSLVLGLYKNETLVGFILGYTENTIFTLNSMYVEKQYRYYVKRLLDFMESFLKEKEIIGWKATAITKEARKSIVTYGANPIEVKYYKEI